MNFRETLKGVLHTKTGLTSLILVFVGCALAFLFAVIISNRALATGLQMACCLLSVFACSKFGAEVQRVSREVEEKNSKRIKR